MVLFENIYSAQQNINIQLIMCKLVEPYVTSREQSNIRLTIYNLYLEKCSCSLQYVKHYKLLLKISKQKLQISNCKVQLQACTKVSQLVAQLCPALLHRKYKRSKMYGCRIIAFFPNILTFRKIISRILLQLEGGHFRWNIGYK